MKKNKLNFLLGTIFLTLHGYSQTVIPNGGFENWQNIGSSNEEPSNWNSNKTGGGNSALGPQTCFREATNPHSGTYCLKLDNASFFGTPSIAVATTGKMEAPTSNPLNNYVHTLTVNPDFNSPFIGRPDSLIGWFRFTLGGTDAPRIHAILHDNFDVSSPDQGGSTSHIIGEAVFNGTASSVSTWTRFAVPFAYNNTNTPQYILITAMASSVQGAGNASTILWVDDLELKYCLPTTGTDVITSCNDITWINGITYSASNTSATFVLPNAAGCDSTVTLNYTKLAATTGTDIITTCNDITWIDGNTYSTSNNSATFILTNAAGCDSTVTLNYTKLAATTGIDVITTCNDITWIDGNTYSVSNNTATFVVPNAAGCDSTVTLNYTRLNATVGTDVQTSCGPITWIDGNTYTTSNSTATFILTNAAGCDSTVTLNLTIAASIDVTTNTSAETIIANATGATYQWIDCDNANAAIAGETNASFTATSNGNYAVIVTQGLCSDTSSCVAVTTVGIKNNYIDNGIVVMPNPNNGIFIIKTSKQGLYTIVNELGQAIQTIKTNAANNYSVSITDLQAGVYFVVGINNGARQKIVVTK